MNTKTFIAVLSGSMVALLLSVAASDDSAHKCARCGAECPTCKVCRPVEETKKVAKTQFECKCEDFCVPGRSNLCGVERGCDECGNVTCTKIWEPTCAQVRSKRVLKKSTVDEEVKVTKWVVEDLCEICASNARSAEPIPQPSKPTAAGPTLQNSQANPQLVESQPITLSDGRMTLTDERMAQLPYFAPAANANSTQTSNLAYPREGTADRR